MTRGNRTGPTVSVQRALGWGDVAEKASRLETASCTCGADLRFVTGAYGQTLEVCSSTGACPGRRPHALQPDPAQLKPPSVPKKRRRK